MVRVSTSTQGTGPLVCGPAIAGFNSFLESLATGDEFYYAVQSVDRPQEREVGRGVLQANNSISRQPLRGALTNFSPGPKTVALVAASEWYNRLQEVGSSTGRLGIADSRSALKQSMAGVGDVRRLSEPGREGDFRWDPLVPIAVHQLDVNEGIYVAPEPSSAGAWVRQFEAAVNVRWFGAKGDGVTSDGPAFLAALAFLRAEALAGNDAQRLGARRLFVPRGHYFLGTTTLDITFSLIIEGETSGTTASYGATTLRWAAGATGIRTQMGNTSGATGTRADDSISGTAEIRNLRLRGGYVHGTTPEGEFHGIHLRSRASIFGCTISRFQGDGIYSLATAPNNGNANGCIVSHTTITECRNGIATRGADVNAWTVIHCDANSNRQWGFFDRSFLGNNYISCHAATNGTQITSNGASVLPPNRVHFAGKIYAVAAGEEEVASANAPSGTTVSRNGWYYQKDGGVEAWNNIEDWTGGRTYRSGGAYCSIDPNARSTFQGCYAEGDMAPSQIHIPSIVIGGLLFENGVKGNVPWLESRAGGLYLFNAPFNPLAGATLRCRDGGALAAGDEWSDDWTAWQIGARDNSALLFKRQGVTAASWNNFLWGGHYHSDLNIAAPGFYRYKIGNAEIHQVTVNGIELAAGKELRVDGVRVVGARQTGWTAATGTPLRGAFAAAAPGTASAAYAQAELQQVLNRAAAAEGRIVALESAMRTHGLIN